MCLDALRRVTRCIWANEGGLDLKAPNRATFVFYPKDAEDKELDLKHALWNFNNTLLIVNGVGSD